MKCVKKSRPPFLNTRTDKKQYETTRTGKPDLSDFPVLCFKTFFLQYFQRAKVQMISGNKRIFYAVYFPIKPALYALASVEMPV